MLLVIVVFNINWGQLFPGKVLLFRCVCLLSHHLIGTWEKKKAKKQRKGRNRGESLFLEVAKVCLEKAVPQRFSSDMWGEGEIKVSFSFYVWFLC